MASEIKVDTIVNAGGDNDSGIDLGTNDNIKFDIAGSQKAMIDSSGNLAVGLSSGISSKLHVASEISLGPDGDNRLIIGSTSAGVGSIGQREAGSSNFSFINFTGGNTLFGKTTTSDANVGSVINATQMRQSQSGTSAHDFHDFFRGTDGSLSRVGNIRTTGSSTAYNTSSDYRLKENVVTDWDATSRLKQLKPSRFNFKTDKDTTVDGFLAHEVQSIVPEAVSGEKDAVDKDGNIDPQGIDQSKLVPLLVKTIQELEARIAILESK